MKLQLKKLYQPLINSPLLYSAVLLARGGGGGSGGGGGGGGGGGFSSSGGSSGSTSPWMVAVYLILFIGFIIFQAVKNKVQKQLDQKN